MRNDNKKIYKHLKDQRDNLVNRIGVTPRGYGKTNMLIAQPFLIIIFDLVLQQIETSKTKVTQEDVLEIMRQYADVKGAI